MEERVGLFMHAIVRTHKKWAQVERLYATSMKSKDKEVFSAP